jgi:hypothetical protein
MFLVEIGEKEDTSTCTWMDYIMKLKDSNIGIDRWIDEWMDRWIDG